VAKTNIRDGFLKYLDKQSITFAPQPVNAFDRYTQGKVNGTKLLWYPSYALVSATGDFGVDTGPWTAHWDEGGKQQTAYGEWLSIWARDSTGTWKALFAAGIDPPAEDKAKPLAGEDVRFTTKGGALYAIFMEAPERESAIASLGTRALPDAVIEKVELLGGPPLPFRRGEHALRLTLPRGNGFTPAVRIMARGLV